VTSPTPNDIAGDRVRAQFDDPATAVVEEASFEAVEKLTETAEAVDPGYLIALGGGKPIDIAKMAADHLGVGFVSVPTVASPTTGSSRDAPRSPKATRATRSRPTRRSQSSRTRP